MQEWNAEVHKMYEDQLGCVDMSVHFCLCVPYATLYYLLFTQLEWMNMLKVPVHA